MLKFIDFSEGLYNNMTLEEFNKMSFFELKEFNKEKLTERFKGTKEYLKIGEVGWFTKFINKIIGWFKTKSHIYTVEDMVEAVVDEKNLFDAAYAYDIFSNLVNLIPKDEKKEDKKEDKKEVKAPEVKTPEVKTPEVKTPEVIAPEVKTPEVCPINVNFYVPSTAQKCPNSDQVLYAKKEHVSESDKPDMGRTNSTVGKT